MSQAKTARLEKENEAMTQHLGLSEAAGPQVRQSRFQQLLHRHEASLSWCGRIPLQLEFSVAKPSEAKK